MKFLKISKDKFNEILIKAYFVMLIFGYIFLFYFLPKNTPNWYVNFPFLILNFIAFFGFAWNKKFFNQLFWKIVFVLGLALKVGSVIIYYNINDSNILEQLSWSYIQIFFIQFLVPVFFRFIPFYLYAFRCENIWNSKNDKIKTPR